MKLIRWTETARSDVRAIHAYISRDSRFYASRTIDRLKRAVERLRRYPESGTRVLEWDRSDLREVLVGSYRVIDHWNGEYVRILTVLHAARQIRDDDSPPE